MEFAFLNTPANPGEVLTHHTDNGDVVGWLIGETDGSKIWIGQMVEADLALAGIEGETAQEPIIWIVAIDGDQPPKIRGMVNDYETAELLATETAAVIRAKLLAQIQ